ncbi:GGDEF domain-containing protein [Intestinimonas butyriciproducens]|uniref:GGDEF domain-containing protein n=1 Tax=Intestinimonas butyriciproducens TaxID=1297617 RepID=UPI0018AC5957|nr:GGDEF domain-containing protein [Intestinimonas butyriciproducens]
MISRNTQALLPFDEQYRGEVETRLAEDAYRTEHFLALCILFMQSLLLFIFCFRAGGPFFSPRRTGYTLLYFLLIVFTLLFLWARRRTRHRSGAFQLRLGAAYAGLVCLWSCAVTCLDQLGGNGLVVFSYMLPALAALTVLTLHQSILIFGSAFLIINLALPFLPGGIHNLFSNLINSFALSSLSIFIAWRLYLSRASAHYGNILVQKQYRELERVNQKLEELADTDQLTGLNNRRYLERHIRQRLEDMRGSCLPVAGLMVDIDFFKQYNDKYGHLAGDECLRVIAEEIRRFAAQGDIHAVRYGGEEFFLCWIGCGTQEAQEGAERLRKAVSVAQGPSGYPPVTTSIGIHVRAPWGNTDFEDFLRQADSALYQAKAEGRNRVVVKGWGAVCP